MMTKKIMLIFGCFIFVLSGCNIFENPRLDANEQAAKITQRNDNNGFIEFYKLIFPEYEVVDVCVVEFSDLKNEFKEVADKTIYYKNPESDCGFQTESILVKDRGKIFVSEIYATDLNEDPNSFKGEKKNSFKKVSTKYYGNYSNIFTAYYFDSKNRKEIYTEAYCPKKHLFETEKEQFINYVYDSYLLMKQE